MDELNEEYVDIMDKKKVYLVPEQIEDIKENPTGLTKEGCMQELENWEKSHNRYMKAQYRVMLKKCEKFQPSGKTVAGAVILARREGKITWIGPAESEK